MIRAWHLLHAAWLRWCIAADENYLRQCEQDALIYSLDLSAFRARLGVLRIRLIHTEGKLRRHA